MLDIVNDNDLYNVFNKAYTRWNASDDSFDTIDLVFVPQNLVPLVFSIIKEMYIRSDHLSFYFELGLEHTREFERVDRYINCITKLTGITLTVKT